MSDDVTHRPVKMNTTELVLETSRLYTHFIPMDYEAIKKSILEFSNIAKQCPENLQDKCFGLLVTHYLDGLNKVVPKIEIEQEKPADENGFKAAPAAEAKLDDKHLPADGDIKLIDLHIKAKRFLQKFDISIEDLNLIFYKEGPDFLPLYEDLKTTKSAESQIRISLLKALVSGIKAGEFEFNGEEVRKECQVRKSYDAGNFSANFKNNAAMFDSFDKYDKQNPLVKLSEDGRKALAKALGELK